jgi:PIN domain nuclease of toxin-antitoxin system
MRFLLDTHCFLWNFLEPHKLSALAQEIIDDGDNEIYLSAVSAWEIAIKFGVGKLSLPATPDVYVPSRMAHADISALPVTQISALRVHTLPPIHKDPFDRLLIAQAQTESLTILSDDHLFTHYSVAVMW